MKNNDVSKAVVYMSRITFLGCRIINVFWWKMDFDDHEVEITRIAACIPELRQYFPIFST